MARFMELDVLRGLAIMAMIVYHFLFDWNFFVQPIVNLTHGFWFYFARATAVLFVGLAGCAFVLSVHRHGFNWKSRALQRGIFLFAWGGIITLVTYLLFPAYTIWFGILHFLGAATLLGILFMPRPMLTFLGGTLFTMGGILLSTHGGNLPPWPILLPLPLQTFDYFPLLPWLGIYLLGMSVGHYFYPQGKPLPYLGWEKAPSFLGVFTWLGKNSLAIYLIHQPLLLGLLWGLGKITLPW